MSIKKILFAFACFGLCSLSASAADITMTEHQWNRLKADYTVLKQNSKRQEQLYKKQESQIETLKKQLKESQIQLEKANQSNEVAQKQLKISETLLKKLKSKTTSVRIGCIIYGSDVKPAIGLQYKDLTVEGGEKYIGIFYNVLSF